MSSPPPEPTSTTSRPPSTPQPQPPSRECDCGCGGLAPIAQRSDPARGHVRGEPQRFIRNHHHRRNHGWTEVDQGYDSPCWLWDGPVHAKGYGVGPFRNGERTRAHRQAWIDAHGPIPDGLHVLHRCDVPRCVRPDHLFLGTNAANTRDRTEKGRGAPQQREHNGRAKLTEADVAALRAAHQGVAELSRRFGISETQVRRILAGESWPGPPPPVA